MATPSSSATSPSPPMAYIPHASTPSQATPSPTIERFDRDNKKKAVQKLIARAELSNVTRSLRNRLTYASHKTPALSRYIAPRDGEMLAQGSNPAMQFARSNTARRKPPTTSTFHGAGPSHGLGGIPNANSPLRRGPSGPSNAASGLGSRHTFSNVNGEPGNNTRYSLGGQTLFTSILAPPPPQQARTILNAGDPPIAPPVRPEPSPREHGASVIRSIAEGTRAHSKSRRTDASPSRRKGKARASKPSRTNDDVDADGDVDMKAAKTLTSLLLQHRPSIAGSASSPRSSFDGSDAGSSQSYPMYPQGSAAAARGFPNPPPPSQGGPSTSTSFREMTPPDTAPSQHQTTPRPAPTDNEAADLMLFLATSPSPARPSKDANNSRDQAAYRALGGSSSGGGLRAKGRVLFPTAPGDSNASDRVNYRGTGSALARGGESSFTSSISSIGSELGRRDSYPGVGSMAPRPSHRSNTPSQLLPPPSLPSHSSVPSSPSGLRKSHDASPRPSSTHEFNIHEFIHASPSPSRGHPGQHKVNLGLRADVGRKLFEGEQQSRMGMNMGAPPNTHMKRPDDRGLGAGIDLLKS